MQSIPPNLKKEQLNVNSKWERRILRELLHSQGQQFFTGGREPITGIASPKQLLLSFARAALWMYAKSFL